MKLKTTILFALLILQIIASDIFDKTPTSLINANKKLWQSRSIELNPIMSNAFINNDSLKVLFTVLRKGEKVGYAFNSRVNSCRQGGCLNLNETNSPSFEYFDFYVIFDSNFQIQNIKVYNYQSSYGYEICSRSWLKQFESLKPGQTFQYGKEIDAISGATISANNLIDDLQKLTESFFKYQPQ